MKYENLEKARRLVERYKELILCIKELNTYNTHPSFFDRVQYECWNLNITKELINEMINSANKEIESIKLIAENIGLELE